MDWRLPQEQAILAYSSAILSGSSYKEVSFSIDSWLTPELRIVVLGTILPASVIAWTLLYDIFSIIPYPRLLVRLVQAIKSPFRDFLQLEDLEEQPSERQIPPVWKTRLLVTLTCVEAVRWAALFAYHEFTDGGVDERIQAGVGFLTWVSYELRIPELGC